MAAFELRVFEADATTPIRSASCDTPSDVTALVVQLLSEHHGCQRIVVEYNGRKLFAVDCHGSRLPD